MATEEARSLLDQLMGGDRNAPLPPGSALPPSKRGKRKQDASAASSSSSGMLLLPGKRHKSCYDKDIDPLYTAWGIDVYELFVNTKSDLGANPYVPDEHARQEYLSLPAHQQQLLGFDYFLFQKLQELVRQCDRTVARNKEKLQQELSRKLGKSTPTTTDTDYYVQTVDDAAAEQLCRAALQYLAALDDLTAKQHELDQVMAEEETTKHALEPLFKPPVPVPPPEPLEQEKTNSGTDTQGNPQDVPKSDKATAQDEQTDKQEKDKANQDSPETNLAGQETNIKTEDSPAEAATDKVMKQEESSPEPVESAAATDKGQANDVTMSGSEQAAAIAVMDKEELQRRLGRLTLQRQKLVLEIASLVQGTLIPLQESVETQHRNLNYVKSDISTDKTVCEVSGNFMSARDADERIAAHYAGKQYVGWKLVREKYHDMIREYGRYGPPPPSQQQQQQQQYRGGAGPPMAPLPSSSSAPRGGVGGGGGRFDRGSGGGGPAPLPPPRGSTGGTGGRGRDNDRGGGSGSGSGSGGFRDRDRGGGGGGGGGTGGGRWERHGPPPPAASSSSSPNNNPYDRDRRGGTSGPPPPSRGGWRR